MLNLDLILGFQWDQGNAEKSDQKHDVLPSESEEIFFNDPLLLNHDPKHSMVPRALLGSGLAFSGAVATVVLVPSLRPHELLRTLLVHFERAPVERCPFVHHKPPV